MGVIQENENDNENKNNTRLFISPFLTTSGPTSIPSVNETIQTIALSSNQHQHQHQQHQHQPLSPEQRKLRCSQCLSNCLFVLMRVAGVVGKYRALLVPGILKLFYIDAGCVGRFVKNVKAKWPIGSSNKVRKLYS